MKQRKIAQIVSIGSMFTTFAVMLQASPIIFPTVGLLISPLSTLPVALSTIYSVYSSTLTLLSGVILLLFISPQEAIIFLLTTGQLGLTLGIQLYKSRSTIHTLIVSAPTLFLGINILTQIPGFAAFGKLTHSFSISFTAMIFILFSLGYTGLWIILLKKIIKHLMSIRKINSFF